MINRKFLKKNIMSLLTVTAAIILFFYSAFTEQLTVFQGAVISVAILVCITIVFEHKLSFDNIEERLEKILGTIPEDTITAFKSFEESVEKMGNLYKKTEISIHSASLDYAHRGHDKDGRNMLNDLKDKFASDKNIEYKYLFYPTIEKLESVHKNFVKGNTRGKKSFYAFVNEAVRLPFASFIIFDKKHVIIRGPYEDVAEPYILISNNKLLCDMFVNWLDMIWEKAKKIENLEDLESYIAKIKENPSWSNPKIG